MTFPRFEVAAFEVTARREDGSSESVRKDSLRAAKAEARFFMEADLDGDCYVAVEVDEIFPGRRVRCFRETRQGSALDLRRLLLAQRRGVT